MRLPSLLLLANIAWLSVAPAQMFSSVQDCDAIYGKPVSPTDQTSDVRFYKHDGLTIKILFVENKAAVITFNSLTSLKIPTEVQTKLLNASAAGNHWEEVSGEGAKTWQRSDGQAFAIYDNTTGELNIFSTDYIEKSKAEVQTAINKQ
ncbi:MAG: hypothetical protein ABIT76_10795 [Chthoniobacterales bacterium]